MFRITSRSLLTKSRRFFSTSSGNKDIELKIHPLFVASSIGFIGSGIYLLNNKQNIKKINWLELKKMLAENKHALK